MALKQLITFVMVVGFVRSLVLKNGAYDDLVIKVSETVPENDCANIIDNLQVHNRFLYFIVNCKNIPTTTRENHLNVYSKI